MEETRPKADDLMTRLGEAASGLLFPSESDSPLTLFRLPVGAGAELSKEALLRAEGRDAATAVEQISAEDFFAPVTKEQEGEEGSDAKRYKDLLDLLKRELSELRVYRVGAVDIDVYVLGRRASGEWIGLKTHVVET